MVLVADLVYLLISLCCAIPSAASILYFSCFMWNGLDLPIGIDGHADWHTPPLLTSSTLLHNALLLLIFPVQHTFTLRGPLNTLRLMVPEHYRRPVYSLSAGLALGLTMYLWQPMPQPVWTISNTTVANIVSAVSLIGFLGAPIAINNMDPFGLNIFGVRKPLLKLLGWESGGGPLGEAGLIETGLYGLVRNPQYSMIMMGIWITPTMSVGHLLLTSVYTLYVILAVKYSEEPALVREMGKAYTDYMDRTPPYIPALTKHNKSKRT
ncbi:methanethiol S-methyltransferase 2-like [Halichondria panicea]|uniref:methanethiol S-methyltransferase 2-like n=1 Tax=Halichondria panicea TaxID=6063 RepID=UPI00312B4F11